MYQLVLTENRVKIKVLYEYIRERDALYRFNKIKNTKAFIPKINIYNKQKELNKVVYEVLLLKKRQPGDEDIYESDILGRNKQIKTDDDEWVVLGKTPYEIEEQYNVTSANRKLTGKEILDHVLNRNIQKNNPKQVVILNNKVVIEGLGLYMVTCKNVEEATRLYNKLRVHCYDNGVSYVIFFGTVPKEEKSVWYKKIHKRTGVGYNRLYRKSSR